MVRFGPKTESLHVALIGDLVASRELSDRGRVQRRLKAILEDLNLRLGRKSLAAPLALTAGDEFQGLLRSPDAAVAILVRLAEDLFPLRIIYGLGRGTLSTPVGRQVAALDGPCFHRARGAIEIARAQGRWLVADGFGAPSDQILSSLFRLMDAIRAGWTEKQMRYAREARGMLRKDVAARFKVSPSVVSESLKASSFDAVRDGEEAARALLASFGVPTESVAASAKRTISSSKAGKGSGL